MTEEEADALDELVTQNPPKVDPLKARRAVRVVSLDDFSADWKAGSIPLRSFASLLPRVNSLPLRKM
jgi:hypothetical protein